MELDELLNALDRTEANLTKLDQVWARASLFIPAGPVRGSDPEYDNLRRTWNDLLAGLPPIGGWTITCELPDIDALGQTYIDCWEIGWTYSRYPRPESSQAGISPSTASGSTVLGGERPGSGSSSSLSS